MKTMTIEPEKKDGKPRRRLQVINERYPYRYVIAGELENGQPDYRLQKLHEWSNRYRDIYLFDNGMQCDIAMEDIEYTKWLDNDERVSAYRHWD
jgi:hypothetical protein